MSKVPESLTESLMYSVKRIEGIKDGTVVSYGSGWAFSMPLDDPSLQLNMIVTNWHVVEGMDHVKILFHTATDGALDGGLEFLVVPRELIFSIQPGSDIAFILFGPQLNEWIISHPSRSLFWVPLTEQHLINEQAESELDACEPILMVGCPSGLWDEKNGFPLFRRGVTASHPAIDFQGKPEFAIDIGVYSGSSGSPVMLWEQGLIKNNKREQSYSPGQRFWLLGTLWGGPRISENGSISVEPVPTDTRVAIATSVRMHLGYVVKSKEVLRLANHLKNLVNSRPALDPFSPA